MTDEPVTLDEIFSLGPIDPAAMPEERRAYLLAEVEKEMQRKGYDKLNEVTRQSEILTERDYLTMINY